MTVVILVREIGVTLLRFWVIRHGVIAGQPRRQAQDAAAGRGDRPLRAAAERAGCATCRALVMARGRGRHRGHRRRLRRAGRWRCAVPDRSPSRPGARRCASQWSRGRRAAAGGRRERQPRLDRAHPGRGRSAGRTRLRGRRRRGRDAGRAALGSGVGRRRGRHRGSGTDSDDRTGGARRFGRGSARTDPDLLAGLERWYADRGRTKPPTVDVQADRPEGARALVNPVGTAPGLALQVGGRPVYAVPGVPAEMRPMLTEDIVPELRRAAGSRRPGHRAASGSRGGGVAGRPTAGAAGGGSAGRAAGYLASRAEVRVRFAGTDPTAAARLLPGRAHPARRRVSGEGDQTLGLGAARALSQRLADLAVGRVADRGPGRRSRGRGRRVRRAARRGGGVRDRAEGGAARGAGRPARRSGRSTPRWPAMAAGVRARPARLGGGDDRGGGARPTGRPAAGDGVRRRSPPVVGVALTAAPGTVASCRHLAGGPRPRPAPAACLGLPYRPGTPRADYGSSACHAGDVRIASGALVGIGGYGWWPDREEGVTDGAASPATEVTQLRRQRLRHRRALREVSSAGRVSLGYLSEVKRGQKEASSELLSSICTALDVPLWWSCAV